MDTRSILAPVQSRSPVQRLRPRDRAVVATRLSERPVIAAGSISGYGPIFNAGVIIHDGRYHLFARAVRDGYRPNPRTGPGESRFLDYVSDLLSFTSRDGLDYSFQKVLHRSEPGAIFEDPRVQTVTSGGEPHFLLSYTNVPARETGKTWRAAICELHYGEGEFTIGPDPIIGPDGVPNKDVVLCNLEGGRIALIQRLEQNIWPQQSIQLAIFDTLDDIWATTPEFWQHYMDTLADQIIIAPRPGSNGVGAGAPPLLVEGELVFFYHERDGKNIYTTRVALLDERSGRVKALLPEPILGPELAWELHGDVDNVIFVQGAQLCSNGTIYLTYGAADRHVGAASLDANAVLAALHG